MGVCRYVLLWLGSVQRGSAVKRYRSRLAIFNTEFFRAKLSNARKCAGISSYGVATISRLLKIIGLFCRI